MAEKGSHTVLVVDDDPGHRGMLEALLGRWGLAVTSAGDVYKRQAHRTAGWSGTLPRRRSARPEGFLLPPPGSWSVPFLSFSPAALRAEGVRERCPVQEECAAPYGIVTAGGKIFGERNWGLGEGPFSQTPTPHPLKRFDWWGGCASGVPLGGKRSGRGDGAYEDGESLSHFLWGCRPWFSIRERSPFAYCFYRCLLGEPRSGKSIGFFSV